MIDGTLFCAPAGRRCPSFTGEEMDSSGIYSDLEKKQDELPATEEVAESDRTPDTADTELSQRSLLLSPKPISPQSVVNCLQVQNWKIKVDFFHHSHINIKPLLDLAARAGGFRRVNSAIGSDGDRGSIEERESALVDKVRRDCCTEKVQNAQEKCRVQDQGDDRVGAEQVRDGEGAEATDKGSPEEWPLGGCYEQNRGGQERSEDEAFIAQGRKVKADAARTRQSRIGESCHLCQENRRGRQ